MNDRIFYGDGTPSAPMDGTEIRRNTKILDLIDGETKQRWKEQEENLHKPKVKDIEDVKQLAKQPLKDFLVVTEADDSGTTLLSQKKISYNRIVERLKNGEVIKSGDDDLFCTIPELQIKLREDGIMTMLTLPTRKEGYKIRKV